MTHRSGCPPMEACMRILSVLAFVAVALPGVPAFARVLEIGDAAIMQQAGPAVVNIAEWKAGAPASCCLQ